MTPEEKRAALDEAQKVASPYFKWLQQTFAPDAKPGDGSADMVVLLVPFAWPFYLWSLRKK